MKATAIVLACVLSLLPPHAVGAQDLVITNARIIDGTGRVIERGSIVITDGQISAVTAEPVSAPGTVRVDVQGMTAMPGLIDTHRHDLLGNLRELSSLKSETDVADAIARVTPHRLRSLLDAGFTTIMMPGMFLSAALEVRRLLDADMIEGPRLLFSGPGFTAPDDFPVRGVVCQGNPFCAESVAFQVTDPDVARARVRSLAEAGVDVIKIFVDDAGADLDDDVLAAMADEAKSHGLPAALHAHRVEDMLDGVRLGVTRLVHTPGDSLIAGGDGASLLREKGVAIATAVSLSSPQFAKGAGFPYSGAARHQRILDNIRHLVDEGVMVAFGTDSPDFITPMVEVEELAKVLEPEEIIAALTRNAAIFLHLDEELGTLEKGKTADLVIIDGDPLEDISQLGRVVFVIRGGQIVADNR